MRGRVYRLPTGRWKVCWQTSRDFATEEEANEAAKSPLPTPERKTVRVSPETAALVMRGHDKFGMSWAALARLLDAAGVAPPSGRANWNPAALRNAAERLRRERAEHDRRAVHSEWNVEEEQDGPANS